MYRRKKCRNLRWPPGFDLCIIIVGENVAISSHVFKSASQPTGILDLIIATDFLIFVF